jgi:hypothetical protein
MALAHLAPAWVGGLLRGISGVCSAWVMVCVNSWCLPLLARQHATAMSGWIYTGVGIGIAATGLLAWLGGHQSAVMLWIELGLLTVVGALTVRQALTLQPSGPDTTPSVMPAQSAASLPTERHPLGLIVCYGAFGYGYIVPATFLPTMGRQLVDDPWVFGLTWPLFGLAAALSVALASRWLAGWPRRQVWAMAQAVMAAGTCIPLLHQSVWALAASAVLVGGTFMVTTMAGLQWARESRALNPTPLLARMTGAFAVGQIAGPLLIRLMSVVDIPPSAALDWANGIATGLLIITAAWLWRGPPIR